MRQPGVRHRDLSLRKHLPADDEDGDSEDVLVLKPSVPNDVYHIDLSWAEHAFHNLLGITAEGTFGFGVQGNSYPYRVSPDEHLH